MNEQEVISLRARIEVLELEIDNLQDKCNALLAELGQTLEAPLCLGLTGQEAGTLGCLLMRPYAFKSTLMAAIYSNRLTDDEMPEPKIIDVFVCNLRKKLATHGIKVETIWGEGYKIDDSSKRILMALMNAEGMATDKIKIVGAA
jgi:two-component system cell cycle response regulator CtrA